MGPWFFFCSVVLAVLLAVLLAIAGWGLGGRGGGYDDDVDVHWDEVDIERETDMEYLKQSTKYPPSWRGWPERSEIHFHGGYVCS